MIHSFLLIGQSNMAGRGFQKDVPSIFNEDIKVLRNGRWQVMSEPIHNDRPTAGIGLAASFAAAWKQKNTDAEIGLIPCADGGTNLSEWQPGGVLFDHAIAQANLAKRSSHLAGILWHQGESDSYGDLPKLYKDAFIRFVSELRKQLDAPDIPFIIGGLGSFLNLGIYGSYFNGFETINQISLDYAETHENAFFVSAEGLTANEDQIHFDATSLRRLGIRYFEAFDTHKSQISPLNTEDKILQQIYNRPLTQKEKTILLENQFSSGQISLKEFQEQNISIS